MVLKYTQKKYINKNILFLNIRLNRNITIIRLDIFGA